MITTEIGLNAGKIWCELCNSKEQTVKGLMKKVKLQANDYYMAIGWLAREGKIYHHEQDGVLRIGLK
ncbi:MAG: winged helix-turn-helix domain-containing protein [Prolixibacteraceae bacterium]|nr:winged helix-turn-helix domain-containing protein [Prolixibacteraceae bacterium]MBN2650140.1 winged helix-turn-helix domain-containing protein [Prolixibacteraceae bacterium]